MNDNKNEQRERPLSTYLHKIINILKEKRRAMTITDLEYDINMRIENDEELINRLKNHINLKYDEVSKRYSFTTPYMKYINSKDTLLTYLAKKSQGLKIEGDLLDTHPNIERWINELIKEMRVRAVRIKGLSGRKCQKPGPDGSVCDLYSDRCDKCIDNKDVVIFPRASNEIEDIFVSEDIQNIWKSIPEKKPEEIQLHFDIPAQRIDKSIHEVIKNAKSRKLAANPKKNNRANSRIPKVVNTHILSQTEISKLNGR